MLVCEKKRVRFMLVGATVAVVICGIWYYKGKKTRDKFSKKSIANPITVKASDSYISTKNRIRSLYKKIGGYSIPKLEKEGVNKVGGTNSSCGTYGEIVYESMDTILHDLNVTQDDVFYDLGSGVGKAIIQAALDFPFKKVVGIELSLTRHNRALQVLNLCKKEHCFAENRIVELKNENFIDADFHDATVVYMCSTCYPPTLMDKLTEKLSHLTQGLRVVTLKKLPDASLYNFELIKQYTLPMSWSSSSGSPVYVYQLR